MICFKINLFSDESSAKYGKVTNDIIFCICKNNLPLSFVDSEGFQYLMKIIYANYSIPSRPTNTQLIDAQYIRLSAKIKLEIKDKFISVTIDLWTDALNYVS